MAKLKRVVIGSICKAKKVGSPDYIQIRNDVNLKKGEFLRLESKKFQLDSIEKALGENKLSADMGEKVKERANSIPEWVRFEIVKLEELS